MTSAAPSPAYHSPAEFLTLSLSLGLGHPAPESAPNNSIFCFVLVFACLQKQFCNCSSGVKDQLLKYTLVSSHGSDERRESSSFLLCAMAKTAQKWECGVCESISEGAELRALFSTYQALLTCWTAAASPGRKDSVYQTGLDLGWDLPPSSAGFLVKQLSSHSCALMNRMTVTVCWRNIWGLLECISASFWILSCISVFLVLGFNVVEQSEISVDVDSDILVIWLQCMPWIAGAIVFRGQSCVHTNERSFAPHVWFAAPFHLSQETNDSSHSAEISSSSDLGQDLRVVTQKFLFEQRRKICDEWFLSSSSLLQFITSIFV